MKPKPFHIGTRVLWACNHPAKVVTAYVDADGSLSVILDMEDRDTYRLYQHQWANTLVHADDGAPLGEWVPITADRWDRFALNGCDCGECIDNVWEAFDILNAIIRGEVSQ